MKIGIDFDNTIAEHEQSFINVAIKKKIINKNWQGNGKKDLKNFIYYKKNGKKKWMEVQGLVYGKYMEHAKLIPNVVNFLKLCKAKKHELFIISHKTKYGHFDSKNRPKFGILSHDVLMRFVCQKNAKSLEFAGSTGIHKHDQRSQQPLL